MKFNFKIIHHKAYSFIKITNPNMSCCGWRWQRHTSQLEWWQMWFIFLKICYTLQNNSRCKLLNFISEKALKCLQSLRQVWRPTGWFNEDEKKNEYWINVKPWKHIPKDSLSHSLSLYGMPCIIKAPRLLLESKISFLWLLQLIIKNQVFIIIGSEKEREKWKRVRLFKSRTLRKVLALRSTVEIMEIFIQGEGRWFKSLTQRDVPTIV